MNGVRWQSYANPFRTPPAERRYQQEVRERNEERQAEAAYQLHLRDQHDDGLHTESAAGCAFCARATRDLR